MRGPLKLDERELEVYASENGLYFQGKDVGGSIHQCALALVGGICLDGAEMIVNIGRVITIPCTYCCSLSGSECMITKSCNFI